MKTLNTCVLMGSLASCFVAAGLAVTPKMDFNNDGRGDMAIGAPFATVNAKLSAGNVTVLYGASALPAHLSSNGSQLLTKESAVIPGSADHFDTFGEALAAGDFNNDGYTDLAIGVTGRAGANKPGSVVVLYGSASGLRGLPHCSGAPLCIYVAQVFTMPVPQVADFFGNAIASGDFNSDGYADLAAGAWGYDLPNAPNTGAVRILYGSPKGLITSNSKVLTLDTTGMQGTAGTSNRFGFALAAGRFNLDGSTDLAIGIPEYGIGGAVSVVYGGQSGLSPVPEAAPFQGGGNRLWTQAMTYFPASGYYDRFGEALAAGNFGNGSAEDLAIGIPSKNSGAGSLLVLYGGTNGLAGAGHQQFNLNSPGIAGSPGNIDFLGQSVAAGNLGYDGHDDLAIGIPNRTVGAVPYSGAVLVLFGTPLGLSAANNKMLIPAALQRQANFGASLSIAQFGGFVSHKDLAIGIPGWPGIQNNQLTEKGAVAIRYGGPAGPGLSADSGFWHADSLGVPGVSQNGAEFGTALSK